MDVPIDYSMTFPVENFTRMERCEKCELHAPTPLTHCINCETAFLLYRDISPEYSNALYAVAKNRNPLPTK